MKTIKYFAALAFPVMLASCVNEEIAVETPLKMQEVAVLNLSVQTFL